MNIDPQYAQWFSRLKDRFRSAQLKAAAAVNTGLLQFYWELGADIVDKQAASSWGDGFLERLSKDLVAEFPDVQGFSLRNLKYIRQWFQYWTASDQFGQQLVAQLTSIPWGHNLAILGKCKAPGEARFYLERTLEHGWSRAVLVHQIESDLYHREGKAISNFDRTLPPPQSDLAQQLLKDPYSFDFLTLTSSYNERELESALIGQISKFLLELGSGFAYLGRQVPLRVGERDFYLDLLFYHTRLHCHVVVELKTVDLEPEHLGKLNFYIKAVDEQVKSPEDKPTVGILICKTKDRLVAEYALSDIHKPMGISTYQLGQALPPEFQSALPSIAQLEAELGEL